MDKATGFRALMIIVAAIALFALVAIYRNSTSRSERFNTTLQPRVDDSELEDQYPRQSYEQFASPPVPTNIPAASYKLAPPSAVAATGSGGGVLPSEDASNEQYRMVDFASGNTAPSSVYPSKRLTTEDLLPKDAVNTKWAQVTPSGQGELRDLNFMTAGWHIGVDTQGQSLKNPNLQLRSEPLNPQYKVSPWNMSTVEPDVSRRPFELI